MRNYAQFRIVVLHKYFGSNQSESLPPLYVLGKGASPEEQFQLQNDVQSLRTTWENLGYRIEEDAQTRRYLLMDHDNLIAFINNWITFRSPSSMAEIDAFTWFTAENPRKTWSNGE